MLERGWFRRWEGMGTAFGGGAITVVKSTPIHTRIHLHMPLRMPVAVRSTTAIHPHTCVTHVTHARTCETRSRSVSSSAAKTAREPEWMAA